jgi:hypothetical protein
MNQAGAQPKGQPDKKEKNAATANDKLPPSKPASAETMSKVRIAGAGGDISAPPAPPVTAAGHGAAVSEPEAAGAPPAAEAPPVTEAAPAVSEPAGPPLIACDFEMLAAGISREDLIAQVGRPQTRLQVTDSRGDSEVYRYKVDGVEVAVVKLRGGVVDSVELIEYWRPKPAAPASANAIKVAGLQ